MTHVFCTPERCSGNDLYVPRNAVPDKSSSLPTFTLNFAIKSLNKLNGAQYIYLLILTRNKKAP
jgi:hypothetical protein